MDNKNHSNHILNTMQEKLIIDDEDFKSELIKIDKANLNNNIISNIKLFENFDINYNRVFILGSLDYLRIVLREENLNKYSLYLKISQYIHDIEEIYSVCNNNNEIFENIDLNNLIRHFDSLQNFISKDLHILPRLDDDAFDDSLFY